MYDKIIIELKDKSVTNIDKIAQRLDCEHPFNNYDRGYRGKLKNFDVTLKNESIKLTGSLSKFFWGNNILNMSRLETWMAIIELSNILKLPMEKAKVTCLEFSFNFKMKYIPKAYYRYFGNHQYLERLEQPNSVYYRNDSENRCYHIYDKIDESKGSDIPNNMLDKHLLRFEIRLKRLNELFGKAEITCKDLYDKDFYQRLLDYYIEAYMEINKNPIISLDFSHLETPKTVIEYFAISFIEKFGQNKAIKLIEEMRHREALKRSEYYSRAKNSINTLCNNYKDVDRTPIIDELTTKVLALKDSSFGY